MVIGGKEERGWEVGGGGGGGNLEEMAMSSGAVFSLCGDLLDGAAESVTVHIFSDQPPLFTLEGGGAYGSTYWRAETLV